MRLKHTALAAALACAAAPVLAADVYTVDKGHTDVSFQIRHLVTNVRGRFSDFAGTIRFDRANPAASSVEFTIQAASIDTANGDRDNHLRSQDFFWSEQHPEITFRSTQVEAVSESRLKVSGTLTLRGVSRPIELWVDYLGEVKDPWGNVKAGFATETKINRKDFGLEWNKALDAGGLVLGEEVTISIGVEAGRKA